MDALSKDEVYMVQVSGQLQKPKAKRPPKNKKKQVVEKAAEEQMTMNVPMDQISKYMSIGGKIQNEDGLIYDVQMNSSEDFKLVSVGFSYA